MPELVNERTDFAAEYLRSTVEATDTGRKQDFEGQKDD